MRNGQVVGDDWNVVSQVGGSDLDLGRCFCFGGGAVVEGDVKPLLVVSWEGGFSGIQQLEGAAVG